MSSSVLPARDKAIIALRASIARMQGHDVAAAGESISLCPSIDLALPARGVVRSAFHEVLAADSGAAIGFSALLLGRASGPVVWIDAEPDIWPAGIAAFGLSSSDLICVSAHRSQDRLWAFEEALRSPGIAGAALMLDGRAPGLAATRRLQLAAETGGGVGLLIMPDTDHIPPSAARSRWRVGAAPSNTDPAWTLSLLRASGGRPGHWHVIWDQKAGELRLAHRTERRLATSDCAGKTA